MATWSTLFHLIRGHKLLPRPALHGHGKKSRGRERERTSEQGDGKTGRRVSFTRVPQIAPRRLFFFFHSTTSATVYLSLSLSLALSRLVGFSGARTLGGMKT